MKKFSMLLFVLVTVVFISTPASAITEKELEQRLIKHAAANIDAMCRQMPDCGGKVEMVHKPDGKWVRTYCDLKKDSIKVSIRKIKEPDVYVGIIKYIKVTYEAQGDSKEAAMQQPFRVVEKNRVTKIRQFKNNKWQ